jgi:hypothetical protein
MYIGYGSCEVAGDDVVVLSYIINATRPIGISFFISVYLLLSCMFILYVYFLYLCLIGWSAYSCLYEYDVLSFIINTTRPIGIYHIYIYLKYIYILMYIFIHIYILRSLYI